VQGFMGAPCAGVHGLYVQPMNKNLNLRLELIQVNPSLKHFEFKIKLKGTLCS